MSTSTSGWQFGHPTTQQQQLSTTPSKPKTGQQSAPSTQVASINTNSRSTGAAPSLKTPRGKRNRELAELVTTMDNRSLSPHDQLNDQFDLTSPLPATFDRSILIDPFTFCLCGTPCSCVVMEYIRLNDWKRLHYHLLFFSQDFLNFMKLTPVMSLSLHELISTTDKLSTMPLLNQTMMMNNVNKVTPVGKQIENVENNHLVNNNYSLDATNNVGSGNITDSGLYRTSMTFGSTAQISPSNHSIDGQHDDNDDGDDYDAFDDKYDEDDNLTRGFDFFHRVVNFSSLNETYIAPTPIHSLRHNALVGTNSTIKNSPDLGLIPYNHHPLSIGSVIYQYDPAMIPIHQHHILTTITNETMNDATMIINNNNGTIDNDQFVTINLNQDGMNSPTSPKSSQPPLLQQHSLSSQSSHPILISTPLLSTSNLNLPNNSSSSSSTNQMEPPSSPRHSQTTLPPPPRIFTHSQLSYTTQKTRRQRPCWLQSRPHPHFLQSLQLNNNDITPIMLSVFFRQPKTLEVLVYHGAAINTTIAIPQQTIHSLHHPRMRFTALDMAIMYLYSQDRGLNDFTMILTLLLIFQSDCLTWTIDHSGHNIFQRLILAYNPYAPSYGDETYFPLPPEYHSYLHWTIDLLLHKSTWFDPYHQNNLGQLLSDVISRQFTMHTMEHKSNTSSLPYLPLRYVNQDPAILERVYYEHNVLTQQTRPLNLAIILSMKAVTHQDEATGELLFSYSGGGIKSNNNNNNQGKGRNNNKGHLDHIDEQKQTSAEQAPPAPLQTEALYKTKQRVKRKHTQLSHFTDLFLSPALLQLAQQSSGKESGINTYLAQPGLDQNQKEQAPLDGGESTQDQHYITRHHSDLIQTLLPKPSIPLNIDERIVIVCDRTIVSPAKQWLFFHFLKTSDPFHPNNLQLIPKLPADFIPAHFMSTTPLDRVSVLSYDSEQKQDETTSTKPSQQKQQRQQQYQFQIPKQHTLHPHHHINDNMFISPTTNKTLLMLMIDDDQNDVALMRGLQKEQLILLERLKYEYTYLTDRYLFFNNQNLLITPALSISSTTESTSSSLSRTQQFLFRKTKGGLVETESEVTTVLKSPLSDLLPPIPDLTTSPFFTVSSQHLDPRLQLQMYNPLQSSRTKILLILTTINVFLLQHRISKRILFIDLLLSTLRQQPIDNVSSDNESTTNQQQQQQQSSLFDLFGASSPSAPSSQESQSTTLSSSLALFVQLEHHDHLGYTAFDYVSSLNNNKQIVDLIVTAYLSYPAAFNTKHRLLAAKTHLDTKNKPLEQKPSGANSPKLTSTTTPATKPDTSTRPDPLKVSKDTKGKDKNNKGDYVLGADYVMLLVPNQFSEDSLDIAIFNQDKIKQQILSTLNIHHARNASNGSGPGNNNASSPRTIERQNGIVDSHGNDVSAKQYRSPRLSIGSMEETTEMAISMRKVKVLTFIQRKYTMLRRSLRNIKRIVSEHSGSKNATKRSSLWGLIGGSGKNAEGYVEENGEEYLSRNSTNLSCTTSYSLHGSNKSKLYSAQLLYSALLSLPSQFRQHFHHYSLIDVLRAIISTPNIPSGAISNQIKAEMMKNASMMLYEYKWWKLTLPLAKAINPILTHNIASNALQSFVSSQGIDLQSYIAPFKTFPLPFSNNSSILTASLGESINAAQTPGRILPRNYFNGQAEIDHNLDSDAEPNSEGNSVSLDVPDRSATASDLPLDITQNQLYNASSHEYNNVYLLLNMLMKTWKLRTTVTNDIDLNLYYNFHEKRHVDVVPWVFILLGHSTNPDAPRYTLPSSGNNPSPTQPQSAFMRPGGVGMGGQLNWIFENTKTPRGIFQLILRLFPNTPSLVTSPNAKSKFDPAANNTGLHFDPLTNRLITEQEAEERKLTVGGKMGVQSPAQGDKLPFDTDEIAIRSTLLRRFFMVFVPSPLRIWDEYLERDTKRAKMVDYEYTPTAQDIHAVQRFFTKHQRFLTKRELIAHQTGEVVIDTARAQSQAALSIPSRPSTNTGSVSSFDNNSTTVLNTIDRLPYVPEKYLRPHTHDDLGDSVVNVSKRFELMMSCLDIPNRLNKYQLEGNSSPHAFVHKLPHHRGQGHNFRTSSFGFGNSTTTSLTSFNNPSLSVPSQFSALSCEPQNYAEAKQCYFQHNNVIMHRYINRGIVPFTNNLVNFVSNLTPFSSQQDNLSLGTEKTATPKGSASTLIEQVAKYTTNVILNYIKKRLDTIVSPTHLNSESHRDMISTLFCSSFHTIPTLLLSNKITKTTLPSISLTFNDVFDVFSTRFHLYNLFSAMKSIFQLDVVTFFTLREQYTLLVERRSQIDSAPLSYKATRNPSQQQTSGVFDRNLANRMNSSTAIGAVTSSTSSPPPSQISNQSARLTIQPQDNSSQPVLDRREQEKELLVDLQTNTMFQQSTPLLINSLNQLLIGWTNALLLLDSNPNTFTYTPASGGNSSGQQNSLKTLENEQISVPLTAIQVAVRSFCQQTAGPMSVAMANGKNVGATDPSVYSNPSKSSGGNHAAVTDHPDDNFSQSLNYYASLLIKLLIQFGSYPYPHSPAIPAVLIKNASASKAVRKGVSSLTLSQLLFTKSTLPQLPLLEFVHAIDFMHLNTPTGVTICDKDPAVAVNEELSQINKLQNQRQVHHNNTKNLALHGSGYTPLHIASRHSGRQTSIVKFMLLNGAYRLIIDDERSLLPLMLLVQNRLNQSSLTYFLKFDGVFSLFYRLAHRNGYKNNPKEDELGLVPEDSNTTLFSSPQPQKSAGNGVSSSPLAFINQRTFISAVKSSILSANNYPMTTEPWFTDGNYDYYPIIATSQSLTRPDGVMIPSGSGANKCVIEFAREEYQTGLRSTILKWKNQAQRRHLTMGGAQLQSNNDLPTSSNQRKELKVVDDDRDRVGVIYH